MSSHKTPSIQQPGHPQGTTGINKLPKPVLTYQFEVTHNVMKNVISKKATWELMKADYGSMGDLTSLVSGVKISPIDGIIKIEYREDDGGPASRLLLLLRDEMFHLQVKFPENKFVYDCTNVKMVSMDTQMSYSRNDTLELVVTYKAERIEADTLDDD